MGPVITLWVATLLPAHSGFPAQAPFRAPNAACATFDREVPVGWADSDSPTPFGPAFIDFFATREDLLTFDVGQTPELPGPPIAARVPEPDRANAFVWRTATVASGHYHLWSVVREPPQEVASVQITERTHHLVTIVHPSERVGPSVAITRPNNALASAAGEYELRYAACDPTGTGRVTLDVAPRGGAFERIGRDLPASPDGRFAWSTRGLPAGTWTVRATITDDCGGYYVGYGRYYVDVIEVPDGGPRDVAEAPPIDATTRAGARCEEDWAALSRSGDAGARADAGAPADAAQADSAARPAPAPAGCSAVGAREPAWAALVVVAILRRRRAAAAPRARSA